jgi:drug/metabolite transporter (DMT)-like permease
VAWNHLLQRYGASTLHTFIFIMPISGIMAGGMILNEPMTASLIAGAALVAAGIIVVNINLTHTPPAFPTDKTF